MKSLILGNANRKIDNIAAAQLYPFFRNRRELRRRLNFTFQHIQTLTITDVAEVCRRITPEIETVFIRPDWQDDSQQVTQVIQSIRANRPDLNLFLIDPWDQVSSRFFGVLPYVNKLLKYQRLKQVEHYQKSLLGGTLITDYLVRQEGFNLNDWAVESQIPTGYEHRIATGWGVVVDGRFEKMLKKPLPWNLSHPQWQRKPKNIDVFCHVSYDSIQAEDSWYTYYRMSAVKAVEALGSKYRLAVSGEYPESRTVSKQQYLDEIQRSHIVVSPFGWGEVTWRDYEAVCNNCLLLKPSVDHIDTSPQIFYPGETYVPLKWDFSDLEEKCSYYLQNPDEAARIKANARRNLIRYFEEDGFVRTIADLLAGDAVPVPPVMEPEPNSTTSLVG